MAFLSTYFQNKSTSLQGDRGQPHLSSSYKIQNQISVRFELTFFKFINSEVLKDLTTFKIFNKDVI